MEEWTAAVAGGAVTNVTDEIITVHTTYFCGSTTAIRTAAGLVLIDTGNPGTASQILAAIRKWDDQPIHTVVYTHGHVDHTSGAPLIDREADARGIARPRIIAHRNVLYRFDRYDATHGLNTVVMGNQFNRPGYVFPTPHRRPDEVYDDTLSLTIGGKRIELFHGRGETDDATFVWLAKERVLASGDFVIWAFPNAGNPRKVQRYAPDWAAALRRMQGLKPDVVIPGHGPVIFGRARAAQILGDGAEALEILTSQTIEMINKGCSLDEILHSVSVPGKYLEKPYLVPRYDDPEYLIRSIWHLYAGWFDGNPANLKPAPKSEVAKELAALAGGADTLAARAGALAGAGNTRLAAHLIEYAIGAAPNDRAIHATRARVYELCMQAETSLIGKAIFGVYERESAKRSTG